MVLIKLSAPDAAVHEGWLGPHQRRLVNPAARLGTLPNARQDQQLLLELLASNRPGAPGHSLCRRCAVVHLTKVWRREIVVRLGGAPAPVRGTSRGVARGWLAQAAVDR